MQKVIIIGSPGAGKSTFARCLQDAKGLPLYYLDMIWHNPDRTTVSRDEFDRKLEKIMERDRWILDGNYLRTMEMRFRECDTVFFLDYPLEVCIAGARARIGKKREDLPWIETEFDEEFRQWILDFSKDQRPEIQALIQKYKGQKNIITFHLRAEAEEFFVSGGEL